MNQSPINNLSCWQPESEVLFQRRYVLQSLDFFACCSSVSLCQLWEGLSTACTIADTTPGKDDSAFYQRIVKRSLVPPKNAWYFLLVLPGNLILKFASWRAAKDSFICFPGPVVSDSLSHYTTPTSNLLQNWIISLSWDVLLLSFLFVCF